MRSRSDSGEKPPEHHRVDRADARAREHGDHGLGDHRQIDRHAVALLHAERAQDVAELVDGDVEVPVGQRAAVAGLALEHERGLVAPRRADVPVEAVDRRVDLAADEPLRVRWLPVEHALPGDDPLERGGLLGPVALEIGVGASVDVWIVRLRCRTEGRRGLELPVLVEQGFEIGRHGNRNGWSRCEPECCPAVEREASDNGH
jgi:hypothetical protein